MALEKEIIREGVGGTSYTLLKFEVYTKLLNFDILFFYAEGEGFTIREILARLR
jgi:hypothetical protein